MEATRPATSERGPLEVCYVITNLGPGGAEGQCLELLRGLDRSRWRPTVVTFDPSTAGNAEGVAEEVLLLDFPPYGNSRWLSRAVPAVRAFRTLRRHFTRRRPAVVHAILPAACILGCPAARSAGVPVVIASRRSLVGIYRGQSRVAAAMDRWSLRSVDCALGNSAPVAQELARLDGLPEQRTATIHNGVNTRRFHPGVERGLRQEAGWTDEHVVLGMVANFRDYKRHIDLVAAAARLRPRFPQARFLLVGRDFGPMVGRDFGALEGVCREIARQGLQDVVRVIEGTDQPERVYSALDVYVCPSETEGFSNVILEAMASGKPVIATRVGGNPEAVAEGENGFLVPPRSPQDIAETAARLISDNQLRQRMGARSRQRAEQEFSLHTMVMRHEQLYSTLLARKGQQV